ncbi:glycosyl hydrolase family 88 [Vibrio nigripulchritudo ATCC 27043]|uniref:glycoside hydrolase family 88 protein n=1 Tax=Vibrio nigripulchritudo TaxID=28173 RepID=UPI00021C3EA7|nr:glycoside hydrolase family 88 protein [Vibrio nigripulchritudo]EGU57960.1 glycosyl hydrolase family 88 [Vibrio nigripulchritudo ATCC 27043]
MNKLSMIKLSLLGAMLASATASGAYKFTPNDMLNTSKLVHDYWVDNGFYNSQYTPDTNWIYGAYHIGEFEYFKLVGNGKAWDNTLSWARDFSYEPHGSCSTTHADHQAAGQVFFELAPLANEPDTILDCLKESVMGVVNSSYPRYWSWADALYMAPAVWPLMADTLSDESEKETVYQSLYTQYRSTYDQLWNEEYDLWARDSRYVYPRNPSPDGSPMFWSRGNGWVFAGIARLLDRLPADAPHYDEYVTNFVKVAAALKNAQQDDGFWGADLIEPHHINAPESSGTTFFVYGMAIGVRLGLLDADTYMPVIEKGWLALANTALQDSGRLGWAQGVAHEPYMAYARAGSSQPYTVGSYLAASGEIYHLLADSNIAKNKSVTCSKEPQPSVAPCSQAVDGNLAGHKRWSADEFPAWIEIDLGEISELSAFRGNFYFDRDYQYKVEVKVDAGSQYETVIDQSDNTDGRASLIGFPDNTFGRYVRVMVEGAATYNGPWVSVREIEVFGKPSTLESIALNKSVSCSDEPQPQYSCDQIVDGKTGSADRWSAMTFPQSVTVDLGDLHTLNGFALSALYNRNYDYKIEVKATQEADYQTIAQINGGDGSGQYQSLPQVVARFAKLTVTGIANNTSNWVSLREWDLYGREYTPELIQPASYTCNKEPQAQYGCENLFDGSTSSGDRWSTDGYGIVDIDFGSQKALRAYSLSTYQDRKYGYKLEALAASGNYEVIDERDSASAQPGVQHILANPVNTSKLRLTVTEFPPGIIPWTSLTELSMYE